MQSNKHPHAHVHTSFIKSTRPSPDASPAKKKKMLEQIRTGWYTTDRGIRGEGEGTGMRRMGEEGI
jgi:hypothetical protein